MWNDVLLYVAVGFAAQMVDGAIGMAYGVTATSVLMSAGVPPATASACVHAAESFTTGASGLAHWRLGNVDRKLMLSLALPGVIGGVLGATVLLNVPGEKIRPVVAVYLMAVGGVVLWRALRATVPKSVRGRSVVPLGFFGGFLDAIGGGGWGAIVTSSLIGNGAQPRTTIGSVNAAEFFVTTAITALFVSTIGLSHWPVIAGLVIGGVIAAPFAALATKHLPDRVLMIIVGGVIILLSARTLLLSF
jgi:uncharacterized protein